MALLQKHMLLDMLASSLIEAIHDFVNDANGRDDERKS